jgi:hypothetical protein
MDCPVCIRRVKWQYISRSDDPNSKWGGLLVAVHKIVGTTIIVKLWQAKSKAGNVDPAKILMNTGCAISKYLSSTHAKKGREYKTVEFQDLLHDKNIVRKFLPQARLTLHYPSIPPLVFNNFF